MRRMISIVAAAVALGLLASGGIVAAAAPAAVAVTADASVAQYPSAVTFYASVADTSTLTTTTAVFQTRSVDTTIWTEAARVTSATGRWAWISAPNKVKTFVRAIVDGVASPEFELRVLVPLGKPTVSARSVHPSETVTFSGTIRPSHVGGSPLAVYLQKWDAKKRKWRAAKTLEPVFATQFVDNDTGRWFASMTPSKRDVGKWRVRSYHNCLRHEAVYSAWSTFYVEK